MSDVWLLRAGILVAGLLLIAAIYAFGRPRRAAQGRRVEPGGRDGRLEPTLGEQIEQDLAARADSLGSDAQTQAELDLLEEQSPRSEHGRRASDQFERIVTLYVAARAGSKLHGADIVVAAEKAGLVYGHMNVFHRLVEGHPERGPIFSVANIMKPGSFDMATIQALETPAIAFFLTLPAPVAALDAWEAMLPTATRMGELLDAVVLDEQRNALGRQRIAHIREEMRTFDRQHEAPPAGRPSRW